MARANSIAYRFKALEHKMTRPFMYEEIFLSNEIMPNGKAIEATEVLVRRHSFSV
jgi:hypothetical protein